MNQYEERPTKAPNLKLLSVQQYHQLALNLLEEMMEDCRDNLRKNGHNIKNAMVKREEWRQQMSWRLKIGHQQAQLVEQSLQEHGRVEFALSYVHPTLKEQAKSKELSISEKYFCHICKKFKGIPHGYRRYAVGDQVNFTQKGLAGSVATNQIGSIQSISGRMLELATATRYVKQHMDSVTPIWAPAPLMYSTIGQCWCDIDPKYLPGGAL